MSDTALSEDQVEKSVKKKSANIELTQARVKRVDLMHLSRQLAAFIRAGIPILQAVQAIAEETDKKGVKRVMDAIDTDLRAGSTLSEAVDKHPKDFPPFYRGILSSAELTGQLDTVLSQLSSYIERDIEARKKIKSAMIYPAVVAAVALGTVVILSVFVLPKFEGFFASFDAKLPWPTMALLASTRFIGTWWWAITALFGVLVTLTLISYRIRPVKKLFHRLFLRLPVIGAAIQYAVIERFCRLMSSMVRAGVMLPDAMAVATESLSNLIFMDALAKAKTSMEEGEGLAGPITATGLFPGISGQMIRVGEDTGSLESQLEVAADYYAHELDYKLKKVTTLIEPAVILFMGGIVGFVSVALISAMYGIFRSANI
ncbi:MAG TPA: type II secretion system F family protein [Acidobacteriaceae bacterium]|nr:type II secretion system F family protein [Acidobacteriaceae bacterium]